MSKTLFFVTLIAAALGVNARAETARDLHDISHLAVGYTANTVAYAVARVAGAEKADAWFLALGITAACAVGKELFIDRRGSTRDAALGITGAMSSGITLISIEVNP